MDVSVSLSINTIGNTSLLSGGGGEPEPGETFYLTSDDGADILTSDDGVDRLTQD